jgi:hypothetical protein
MRNDSTPVICTFSKDNDVCLNLISKFGSEFPSGLLILEYIDPLFVRFFNENNAQAQRSVQDEVKGLCSFVDPYISHHIQ